MPGSTAASFTRTPVRETIKQYWNYGATVGRPTAAELWAAPLMGAKQEVEEPPRRVWNGVGVTIALVLPWTIFVPVFAVMSFGIPGVVTKVLLDPEQLSAAVCVLGFLVVAALGWGALASWTANAHGFHQPTWYTFLFLTSLLAWTLAMVCGEMNWSSNWSKYNQINDLNVYTSVDPATKGEQLMDAGRIHFAESAQLNFNMSMGFQSNDLYCVVPVASASAMTEYDYWAVGVGCCSEGRNGDFHCGESRLPMAKSGLRLFRDDQRPFFNLAVQQAEAAFKITAKHPIFIRWMVDVDKEMDDARSDGIQMFQQGVGLSLLVQATLIAVAAVGLKYLGW